MPRGVYDRKKRKSNGAEAAETATVEAKPKRKYTKKAKTQETLQVTPPVYNKDRNTYLQCLERHLDLFSRAAGMLSKISLEAEIKEVVSELVKTRNEIFHEPLCSEKIAKEVIKTTKSETQEKETKQSVGVMPAPVPFTPQTIQSGPNS